MDFPLPREQTYQVGGRTLVARVEPLFFDGEWRTLVARFSLKELNSPVCLLGGASPPLRRVPDFMDPGYISRAFPSLSFSPQELYDWFKPLTLGLCDAQYL